MTSIILSMIFILIAHTNVILAAIVDLCTWLVSSFLYLGKDEFTQFEIFKGHISNCENFWNMLKEIGSYCKIVCGSYGN